MGGLILTPKLWKSRGETSPDSFPLGRQSGGCVAGYARLRRPTHVPQLVQDSLMAPLSGALSYRDAAKIVRHRVPGQVGVNAHRSWFQVTAVSCVAGVLELFPQLEGNQMSSRRPGSRPVGGCSERLGGGGPRWRDPVCQWPGGVAVPLCPRRPTRPAHRDAGAGVCPVGPRGAPEGLLRTPGGLRPELDGGEVIDQNRVVSPACLRGRQRTTPVPGERHLVPHWHRGRPSGHCGRARHDQSQEVKPEARPNIISLDGNQTDFEETHRPLA